MGIPGMRDLAATVWPPVDRLVPDDVFTEIRGRAPEADRTGNVSRESLVALRTISWAGLPVPVEFGGAGATLAECCAVQRLLGAADPGLAVAVNMHLFTVGLMTENWRRSRDDSWMLLETIATQRHLVASAFAEPHLAGSISRSTLRARRVANGWEVSGVKSPCSLAAESDLMCLQAETDPGDGASELLIAMLPTTTEGVRVEQSWDTLGMRGSASRTVRFDRCLVPDEAVFHRGPAGAEDDDIFGVGLIWFCLSTVATYLGVAQGVFGLATEALHQQRISYLKSTRAELPSFQAMVGDAAATILPLEVACAALAERLDRGTAAAELLPLAVALKQQSIDVVPQAISNLIESCGSMTYSRARDFERLWRDAQAIRFHPPTRLPARQFLGQSALGLPPTLNL